MAACLIMLSVSSIVDSFCVLIKFFSILLILGASEKESSTAVSTDKAPPGVSLILKYCACMLHMCFICGGVLLNVWACASVLVSYLLSCVFLSALISDSLADLRFQQVTTPYQSNNS